MNRSEMISALTEEYRQLRARDESEALLRAREIESRIPEITELRAENQRLAFDAVRKMLAASDAGERARAAEEMKENGLSNNRRIRELLKANGYEEDALETKYRCPLCRDTGYTDDVPSVFCECFENRLRQMRFEDGSMAGTAEQNFDVFDLNRFPEENDQRRMAARARELCEAYADALPGGEKLNVLISGTGGLGKTFLLNCIYERAVSRGVGAIRITAFRLLEIMRRRHFRGTDDGEETSEFDDLLGTELLLIDDLGSEPMLRNITVEYLFTLLNERMAGKLHTVIATNLRPSQLQETYGERVASRLLDARATLPLGLKGKDLRKL